MLLFPGAVQVGGVWMLEVRIPLSLECQMLTSGMGKLQNDPKSHLHLRSSAPAFLVKTSRSEKSASPERHRVRRFRPERTPRHLFDFWVG